MNTQWEITLVHGKNNSVLEITDEDDKLIAELDPEDYAAATLAAAAPDLLDACKQALRRIEHLNTGTDAIGKDPTVTKLKRAIAKATTLSICTSTD